MTQQIPPTEPLDEQERELARIVRALPGGEPPAALDARILKAAANAAAASRRPRSRWLASASGLWGIGGAAAAVLALGVSWQMMLPTQRSSPADTAPAAEMAEMADQAEDSSVSVEFKDQRAREYDNSPPPPPPAVSNAAPARRAQSRMVPPSAPPPAALIPEPFAGEHLDEHVAASAEAGASADVVVASPAMAARDEASAMAAKAAATQSQARAAPTRPQAGLSAAPAIGTLAAEPEIRRMTPANWLAHIRQLRDDSRRAEAKASLLEFHKRYPDFVIPSDLAPLLHE